MTDEEKAEGLRRLGLIAFTLCILFGFTLGMATALVIFSV